MTVRVAHTTQSDQPDSGDGKISSNAWNEDHTITGLGTAAASDAADFIAASDASAFGLTLLDDADAATARSTLGLGTAATHDSTDFLTGNQTVTLSGDVSGSGGTAITTAIGANKVTRGMLAATSGATILGATAAGNVADLTAAQAKTFLAVTAADITNTPAGNIAATTVQAAINELDSEKLASPGNLAARLALAKVLGTGVVLGRGSAQVPHTGDTSVFQFATVTLPANSLGANGQLVIEAEFSCPSNANTKTFSVKWGTVSLGNNSMTTNTGLQLRYRISNRNATNSQRATVANFNNGAIGALAQDTTADVVIALQGLLGNAADTINLESYIITAFPSD